MPYKENVPQSEVITVQLLIIDSVRIVVMDSEGESISEVIAVNVTE